MELEMVLGDVVGRDDDQADVADLAGVSGGDGFLPQAETTATTQNAASNPESSFLLEGFLSLNLSFSIF